MWFRRMAGCLALVVGCGRIQAASAGTLEQTLAASWSVSAYSNSRTGRFDRCEAGSEPQGDARLLLALDRDRNWSLGLAGNLGVQPGTSHAVTFRINRSQTFGGMGNAVREDVIQLHLPDPFAAIRTLRYGREVTVDGGSDPVTFQLRDMMIVLTALQRCAEEWRRQDAALPAPPPASAGRSTASPPVPSLPTEAERRFEASAFAIGLLTKAKISGFAFQPGDVPARLAGQDAVWRVDNLTGSVRLIGLDGSLDLRKVRADLVTADVAACDGPFSVESSPEGPGTHASVFTLCRSAGGWSSGYLVMPRQLGGAYVVSLLGRADQAEALRATAGSLRGSTVEVVAGAP